MKRATILIAVLALAVALPASAKWRHHGGDMPGIKFIAAHAEELGIDDATLDRLDAMHYEHQKAMVDLGSAIRKAEIDFEQLMSEDKPNRSAIGKAFDRLAAAQANAERAKIMHRLDVRELFGPDLCDRIMKLRKEMRGERRMDRPGMGMHPGMGPDMPGMGPGMEPGSGPGMGFGMGTCLPTPPPPGN
jgi:hypothetical protein